MAEETSEANVESVESNEVAEESNSLLSPSEGVSSSSPSSVDKEAPNDGETPASWFYDEGIPGKGDKPEWLDTEKYKSVVDAAKGIKGLRQKLGGFTGAPEEYEYTPPEEGGEVTIDTENALYKDFSEYAKKSNMSNESFNEAVNLYRESEASNSRLAKTSQETYQAEQITALGDKGRDRLDTLNNWITSSVPEKYQKTLRNMATSAEEIEALEFMQTQGFTTPLPNSSNGNGLSTALEKQEIYAIMRGEGTLGKQYQRDTKFQEDVRQMLLKQDGVEDDR